VTYNNFACVFRRTKKLRSALSYLEKALEIEYNYLHFSDETVDECLQVSNPCDIHLNICAILSQMGKHELALQHAMKALILIQDELVNKLDAIKQAGTEKKPEDRLIVLCIAYHNIAVEQEFLK
jgi:tetratricopeptide (TPR) repeat protein